MQIHELNNFTGTLGSGAYLAIDDGTDTGKISSQGLLAATEARIDNIIAGPAPSAEEIVDARLGADGVTYPSLGDAIRDQFTGVKSDIDNLLSDSKNLINPKDIIQRANYVRVTPQKNGARVYNIQAGTYKRATVDIQLDPNTEYTISCKKNTTSGVGWIAYCESSDLGATYPLGVATLISRNSADDVLWTNTFTTTTGYVRLSFYCTYDTSVIGDVLFYDLMLNKGSYQGYFEPYAFAQDYEARHMAEVNNSIFGYVYKLKQGTLIESGANLDNYTTAGTYVASSGTLARSLSNCPTRQLFSLQVEYLSLNDNSYLIQRITDLTGNEYRRARQGGTFTSWRQANTGMSNFGTMLKTSLNGSIPTIQTTAYDANNVEHTVHKSSKTYSEFLTDTWDTLVTSHPTKVAKTQIGMDSSNTYPIYKYVITPEYYSRTVLITAGMHGCECEAMYGLYRMMRYWLRSYDVMLGRKIKYDTRFVIIPVVNPWGMMNVDTAGSDCGRNCALGIQPYRDFPNAIDTVSITSEAAAVRDVMDDYSFDYYVDLHTDPFTASKGCYGYALDNSITRGALFNITRSFYYVILKEYGYSETVYDGVIPHNATSSLVPSRYAENLLNIPSNLFEVAIGGFAEPSSTWTMKAVVDWYINAVSDILDVI